ncbi:2-oxoadipate dioxygenase/decarboxylase HglS [Halotalea alkalilenta]|uniref:2-oxoadipate dioxygenase/decarboxylase HglS n=1 Tax=Halotalea alkalilenta TaxID=376489 RepID=UPI00047F8030|nr:VOC family protein [Halotalea alkalilenta]
MPSFVSPDEIRTRFSQAMSAMYQQEVPQYGELLDLVAEVNQAVLTADPALAERLASNGELERLGLERHGAIRVGKPDELFMLRRLFAVMGMSAVGYYDLSVAGVPVHSTAFRPVGSDALSRNPFRVFTSLLRLELIDDPELRERAADILEHRDIFTPGARRLIDKAERAGGLSDEEADRFVLESLESFRWHRSATVDRATYRALHEAHRLVADVVCFKGPHINHLTPRTLDIDAVQRGMPARGITPKATIEGPPRRRCPLLLRQTSFKALEEPIMFQAPSLRAQAGGASGSHTARFGEIEARGAALTPKGRALYDQLLEQARTATGGDYEGALARAFEAFPDELETMRREGLAYFRYRRTDPKTPISPAETLDALIARGAVEATPLIYEDFLPVSAAGIFQSNLDGDSRAHYAANANREAFEQALGAPVLDEFALYGEAEARSIAALARAAG